MLAHIRCRLWIPSCALIVACQSLAVVDVSAAARWRFVITDTDGEPLPCRIHVANAQGEPQHPIDLPSFRDHFVCPGEAELDIPAGAYHFEIERGPEYEQLGGDVDLRASDTEVTAVTLQRIAHLREQRWYSGDLHIHRPFVDVPLLMRAEDLDVGPVITWWNNRNGWAGTRPPDETLHHYDGHRFFDVMAGEDEREGGALLYFGLDRPLEIATDSREFPSPMAFLAAARERNPDVWIDIEKPFWWDVPVWLASGRVNSIGVANNHMCRSRMYETEAWGRPRDAQRLPAPRGNGFWTQEIYYHLLNAGLRVPPSAGSASGVLPNPVGYNRVYVHVAGEFTYEKWWAGLEAGCSFVTNGPLLTCTANGHLPGQELEREGEGDGPSVVEIVGELTTRDPVSVIEIIHNGEVVDTIATGAATPVTFRRRLSFESGGWFLVRAIADVEQTFRFASTAPFFLNRESEVRISRNSSEFFLNWARERAERVRRNIQSAERERAVMEHHDDAIRFWEERVHAANTD
jgi:hypothetical protein